MTYTLIHQVDSQYAHVTFNGTFLGKTVTWDTDFFTLKGFQDKDDSIHENMKQFINIEPLSSETMKLTVVLKISEINNSSIQKMMIMIKQYKALTIGRHEYG